MNNETISRILRENLKVVPKAFDMNGENFNCDCHLEITDKAYILIGEGDEYNNLMTKYNIPNKLITITYKDEKIEVYE